MSRTDEERAARKAKKEAMKLEAKKLGISYDELKERKNKKSSSSPSSSPTKSKKREAESLESTEHVQEKKRMRAYSGDGDLDGAANQRRRTRSMDAEEEKALQKQISPEAWRNEHSITIKNHGNGPESQVDTAPFMEFSDAPFCNNIQKIFKQVGFDKPTHIQSQAWPIAIKGKDMICIAKTGSGKTCGFLLPSMHQFLQSQESRGGRRTDPVLLVLAPTRELAVQIMEEAQRFGRPLGIRSLCCYGGSSKYPQIAALQRGVECIIATPGRLNDLLEMRKANLSNIKFVVLDEADRMLDMGFEPQIRSIMKHVPTQQAQTLLFSATWPKEIQRLAFEFLKDPIQINVGEVGVLVANKDITQKIIMTSENEKFDKLKEILTNLQSKDGDTNKVLAGGKTHAKVIVFVAKKVSCNDLANHLWDDGFAVDSLHGDRPQWERTKVMNAFKSGQLLMLIATDVAARGLDVKDVGAVVNYDMPCGTNAVEDYVHRIGRTGRAGNKGEAFTFFTQGDRKCARQLVEVLGKAGQEVPPELQAMVPRFSRGGGYGGRGGRGRGGGGYRGGRGRGYMSGRGGGFGRGRGGGRGGGGGYRRY